MNIDMLLLVWVKGFIGGRGRGTDIAVGPDGSVYTSGAIGNTIDFDPGPDTYSLTQIVSYDDAWVAKLNVEGDSAIRSCCRPVRI